MIKRRFQNGIARLHGPPWWVDGILHLLYISKPAGCHKLHINCEADAVGPGVGRINQAMLATEPCHFDGLGDAASKEGIWLKDMVATPFNHHFQLWQS